MQKKSVGASDLGQDSMRMYLALFSNLAVHFATAKRASGLNNHGQCHGHTVLSWHHCHGVIVMMSC